jgi:ABC-type iron transport system FetAB ATPase subunit
LPSILTADALQLENIGPFDLSVASGQCLAITGPSGAGKSLLLRMIADLLPHKGSCRLDDVDCSAISGPQWRRMVRYSGSEPGWWAPTIGAHFNDPSAVRESAERLGLSPALLDAAPERLSTGERQRFALLRATEQRPRFLLLDEPTSALDQQSTLRVEGLIADLLASDVGVIIVSHSAEQVGRLGDAVLQIGGSR